MLTLMRPMNALFAALSVILGTYLSASSMEGLVQPVLCAAGAAFFIAAFGNVINDILDLPIDQVNRSNRPLPSGKVTARQAYWLSAVLLLSGLTLSRTISPFYLVLTFGVAVMLYLYSLFLKNSVLWGNLLVAGITAFTLIYGGLLTENVGRTFFPAMLVFLVNLAREIIKDLEDIKGDSREGLRTLPIVCGEGASARIAAGVILVLILFSYLPYYTRLYGRLYFFLITFFVTIPLFYVFWQLVSARFDQKKLGRLSFLLKWIMLAGFLAILVGNQARSSGVA